jgi:methylase of polypeptide subunit release factors
MSSDARPSRRVDLLVANLPYVPGPMVSDLPVAASFEPVLALDGGQDGLTLVRRLLPGLPDVLAPRATALLEIGADQADRVQAAVAAALPGWSCSIRPDLSGAPRVADIGSPDG